LRETTQTQVEAQTVIAKKFEGRARSVAEDEQRAAQWIFVKLIPAKSGE
jgi:hypothetical protein